MKIEKQGARLLNFLAHALPRDERNVVLGDLQEDGTELFASIRAVIGYAVRLELEPWRQLNPWLVLLIMVAPCSVMLGSLSMSLTDGDAIYVWLFTNNWDTSLLHQPGFWVGLRESLPGMVWSNFALVCWSWSCGAVIRMISRRAIKVDGLFLCLFFIATWFGWRPPTGDLQSLHLARDFPGNAAVFENVFYRTFFSPLVQIFFVMTPLFCGMSDERLTLRNPWALRVFWTLVGTSLASLALQATLWWQMRTWTISPPLTPHLLSVLPLAFTGGIAYVLARCCSRFESLERIYPDKSSLL